jgi:hypothetical protein
VSQPAGQRIRPRGEQPRAGVSVTQAADSTGELPVTPSSEQVTGDGRRRRNRRKPRRARVYVTRLDPWSVAKAAFLLALAIGIVIVVAVAFVFWTLDSTGALDAVSRTVDDVLGTGGFDLLTSLEFSRVLGLAAVLASVEIVLVSLLATLFAFLYNITVGLTGGIEVVLSDE